MSRLIAICFLLLAFPTILHADPVSAFITALTAGAGVSAAAAAFTAAGGWAAIGAFLSTPFGSLVLGIGIQLVTSLFVKKPEAPSVEAAKINVRVAEPERWLAAGRNRQGGGVIFGEFDSDGNFWYIIVHSDTILNSTVALYFDDEVITLDENGFVENDNFLLDGSKKFQIFTTTYTAANPTPSAISELENAFPGVWTSDHKLVGTTYSAIKISPIAPEDRYKVFRWRGPLGVGEPSFSIVGNWTESYDPRENGHMLNDKTTHEFTRNPVLLWAWFRTHRYGRNKSINSVNWDKVEEQANICDLNVTDVSGNVAPRWVCDISIPETLSRSDAEQQILMSCDAQIVFDDDGKCWPRVGYHYTPSVNLYRNRDIVAMESVEAQNGESLTQGVIVRYIDPDANYTTQPCAPYTNPFHYVEGETPKYLVVDALSIQNHRQAMMLAKAISHRSQPEHKLLPTTGLRGLRARQERIVNLQYDNDFSGDYEIVTPTEVDDVGVFVGFGCVPVDQNRWTLLAGEEKPKPSSADSQSDISLPLPTGVVLEFVNSQIKISHNASSRADVYYEFQYQLKTGEEPVETDWLQMSINSAGNFAYVGVSRPNSDYYVRWRTCSAGGQHSDWVAPIPTINASTLTLSGTPISPATVDEIYTGFTINVTGGQLPYIFTDTFGRLPPGLTINAATGAVSGTPDTVGTYLNVSIRVQDNLGNFKDFPNFEIEIEAAT